MTAVLEPTATAIGSTPALPGLRRIGGALTMIIGPWGFVVCNTGYAWSIRHGGSDSTGAAALALAAEYPTALLIAILGGLVGCLLIVPAVITTLALIRRSAAAFVGGVLMIAGYVCYFGVLMTNVIVLAMADLGPDERYAAAIDAGQGSSTAWVFLLFVVGNLAGTVIFAIGLWRSRSVPVAAAVLILCWPPLHVLGLVVGSEWFEVTGAVLQAIGFALLATRVLARR